MVHTGKNLDSILNDIESYNNSCFDDNCFAGDCIRIISPDDLKVIYYTTKQLQEDNKFLVEANRYLKKEIDRQKKLVETTKKILESDVHIKKIYEALWNLYDAGDFKYKVDDEELKQILKEGGSNV